MEKLAYLLTEWFESTLPEIIPRDIKIDFTDDRFITTIAGVRRSGKTYTFFDAIKSLKQSHPASNIIFINFEDDRLLPIEGNEVSELLNVFRQRFDYHENKRIYLFLDEIQNIPDWEKSIRRIHDHEQQVKIAITGSSSKLLSTEIATSLRGRTISYSIYTLSFNEFLRFNTFELKDTTNIYYSSQRDQLIRHYNEYQQFGGFPDVVLSKNKTAILKEYFRAIFYRDIVERYNIRNIQLFENLMKLVVQTMSARFSYGKIQNVLASIGQKVSKATLVDYMAKIESSFFAFQVPIFSYAIKDQLQYPRKIYLIDPGIRNAVTFRFSDDSGRLMENVVFNHLQRQADTDIYYWANEQGYEVDFVIKNGMLVTDLIQVCERLHDDKTKKREFRALISALNEFNLDKATIITLNEYGDETVENKTIHIRPIWMWLLTYSAWRTIK